jgi:hypothetical protein
MLSPVQPCALASEQQNRQHAIGLKNETGNTPMG